MQADIDLERRRALKTGSALGLFGLLSAIGLICPGVAFAEWHKTAFEAKTMEEALTALGVIVPEESATIQLTTPDVAENGAVVPVTVESTLLRTEQIFILVDRNPTMLVASFSFPEGTEAYLTTRIRMAQTATVIALVKSNGKFYRARREVKVTTGGCG